MTANQIQKYSKYTLPKLRQLAGVKFRRWIRNRDKDQPCISCPSYSVTDAGHYYSAGHHPELEYNEDNVHGQCRKCNMFLSGNLIEYRKGLVNRIGIARIETLDEIVAMFRKHQFKHSRFFLIEIIEKYG